MKYDYLIVGAGFTGAVAAERLASSGGRVLVIDQRDHIGGNCYDEKDENGILIHRYGPHIFHTKNKRVWDYLSKFTEWLPYRHRVLSSQGQKTVSLPVSLRTVGELYNKEKAEKIKEGLVKSFGRGKGVVVSELLKNKDKMIREFAEEIFKNIYLNYSLKQWGEDPLRLDEQVLNRVPVWMDEDESYFKDPFQGMPKHGYTKLFLKMLTHPNIKLVLNQEYKDIEGKAEYQKIIYTGPIDAYFNYRYGRLPYRSIRFQFEHLNVVRHQDAAVVNYPGEEPFTRCTEFKHFGEYDLKVTAILKEYPKEHDPQKNIPCYAVPKRENYELYHKYKKDADKHEDVVFVGRLAEYKYYNMDEAVMKALEAAK